MGFIHIQDLLTILAIGLMVWAFVDPTLFKSTVEKLRQGFGGPRPPLIR